MSRSEINVVPNLSGGGFHVDFLNGSVEIPDEKGGYCISCGFGAGKTTSIRQLIRMKYEQGIIYCVDTVNELERMYSGLLEDINAGLVTGLTKEDIICLRGHRNEKDGADPDYNGQLKDYKRDPSGLCSKKVILLTHCRFFSELIQYFLIYSSNPKLTAELASFGGDFGKLMKMPEVRKYIIFDETPNLFRPLVKIPKALMYGMTKDEKDKNGHRKFYTDPLSQYDSLYKGSDWDLFKGTSPFSQQKKYTVLSALPQLWPEWENDDKMQHCVHFYPSHLIQPDMNCHVLLFEGVADVLLSTSKAFSLIDLRDKYNAKVNCLTIPFDYKRKDKKTGLKQYVDYLEGILKGTAEKTLIVVWKDIPGLKSKTSNSSPFRDALKEKLKADGYDDFEMTYYGASDCKSTNAFLDCKNIILMGDWCIDVNDLQTTSRAYDAAISVDRWKFYYFIQTIGRIGIRKHSGGEYNVFFSSDFDPGFVEMVRRYLNDNEPYSKPKKRVDKFENVVKRLKESKYRAYLRSLADYDLNLISVIEKGLEYTLTLPIDKLKELCPKAAKRIKPSDYKYFAIALFKASKIKLRVIGKNGAASNLYGETSK